MTKVWLDKIKGDNLRVLAEAPIKPLIAEVESLNDVIKWTEFGHKGKQAGLQYRGGEDPWTSAVGRMQQPEHEYKHLNPAIKGTMLEGLIERYELFRARLMWVGPYACYSMHRDMTMRIHIPIITNPSNFFVFQDSAPVHIPAGWSYKIDTTNFHTFMNCSDKPRLHLVGIILDSKYKPPNIPAYSSIS